MEYFIFFGILQGFFLAWFCYINRDKNRVGFIALAWLLILFSLILLEQWILLAGYQHDWLMHSKRSTTWLPFLLGPCFYLACRSTTLDESQFRKQDWLHTIPALLHFVYLIPYYLSPITDKAIRSIDTPIDVTLIATIKSIQMLIYLFLARQLLTRQIDSDSSGLVSILKTTIDVFFVCVVLVMITFYSEVSFGEIYISADEFSSLLLTGFFVFTSYAYVFYWKKFALAQVSSQIDAPAKIKTTDDLDDVFKQVKQYILVEALFTNAELRMEDVAKSVGLPLHYLSYIINQCSGQNFQTLINTARVEYVIKHLNNDHQKLNLLNIAMDAGFNSKATFNRVFKQITGITPSQHRDSVSKSS